MTPTKFHPRRTTAGVLAALLACAPVFAKNPAVPAAPTAKVAQGPNAEELAAEAKARQMRQAVIETQQRLRKEQQAREAAHKAETRNERCVNGRRIHRIANGWEDAGSC